MELTVLPCVEAAKEEEMADPMLVFRKLRRASPKRSLYRAYA
jgi:hypothetical protein